MHQVALIQKLGFWQSKVVIFLLRKENMSEILNKDRQFEIQLATLDDVVGIGEAHLQSWLETYPNEEFDVTETWIRAEFGYLTEDGQTDSGRNNGIPFRRKLIESDDPDTIYEVVKDEGGQVQGFLHATKQGDHATLDAIYLTSELKGTGVASALMKCALGFLEGLPIRLQVIAYNERAIKFYEKHGFQRGKAEQELFHGKMPVLNMERKADEV
jgi:ribosomal protein S18 acetylase RimI-like enzyme